MTEEASRQGYMRVVNPRVPADDLFVKDLGKGCGFLVQGFNGKELFVSDQNLEQLFSMKNSSARKDHSDEKPDEVFAIVRDLASLKAGEAGLGLFDQRIRQLQERARKLVRDC